MTTDSARILALGDSYTIGESVDPTLSWPVQLAGSLRAEGVGASDPLIIARTGWTTDELQGGIDDHGPEGPFDLVTLLIGVNDQYRGRDAEGYRVRFSALLEGAVAFAGGHPERVVVLSIPDWGVMPFADGRDRMAIGAEIDAYNRVNHEVSRARGAVYIDVTDISRGAPAEPVLVAEDGLHPSAEQYRRWVEVVLPLAKEVLENAGW